MDNKTCANNENFEDTESIYCEQECNKRKRMDSESETDHCEYVSDSESDHQRNRPRKRKRVASVSDVDSDDVNTESDTESVDLELEDCDSLDGDPKALSPESVKMIQAIVFNGELDKIKITKRLLLQLLENMKCADGNDDEEDDEESSDGDSNDEGEAASEQESEDEDALDQEFNNYQLQVLRTVLKATEARAYSLTKESFIKLIECFVN
jgi:hypothetical protein